MVIMRCQDTALQGFADDVFEAAYNITTDAQSGLGIFDDLTVILNVDVNTTGMNTDVQVSFRHMPCHIHTTPKLECEPKWTTELCFPG